MTSNEWSKDWSTYDWRGVSFDPDSENPVTTGELDEYIQWLRKNDPTKLSGMELALHLILGGMGVEEAARSVFSAEDQDNGII